MRLKSVVKYNVSETKFSILIFYGIMAAIFLLVTVSVMTVVSDGNAVNYGGGGGTGMASAIFLFVVGLNSFKQNYLFLSTNGISRKTQFYGFLISSLLIVAVMGAIDTAYGNIINQFQNYSPMFEQVYGDWVAEVSKPLLVLISFVWNTVLYLFTMCLGYFITTLYYRMSKMLKIIVSVGVPVFFTMVLPAIDATFTNGRIYGWIGNLFLSLGGFKNGVNPLIGIISLVVGSAILVGFAFMLVRKAPIKE